MRDLKFIQSCPDDSYYLWQVHTWLESLKSINQSQNAISLIFTPGYREKNDKWQQLVDLYPESEFFFYKDDKNEIGSLIGIYIPILRPFILQKYFELHPELEQQAIFYCDSDIVFTSKFNISHLLNDEVCYVSDTNSYINADYFDSKIKDVIPHKQEKYKKRDILEEATSLIGISREIAQKNNLHSGGAQYLLKNINASFWEKMLSDCIKIRIYLQNINKQYFESENKGFQSWCSDMFSLLWNLWHIRQEVKVVPEMNFAWSSDPITKLENMGILHNAGIVGNKQGDIPVFYKGNYHQGKNPFKDPYLQEVAKNKTLCNHFYVQKMIETHTKHNLIF